MVTDEDVCMLNDSGSKVNTKFVVFSILQCGLFSFSFFSLLIYVFQSKMKLFEIDKIFSKQNWWNEFK